MPGWIVAGDLVAEHDVEVGDRGAGDRLEIRRATRAGARRSPPAGGRSRRRSWRGPSPGGENPPSSSRRRSSAGSSGVRSSGVVAWLSGLGNPYAYSPGPGKRGKGMVALGLPRCGNVLLDEDPLTYRSLPPPRRGRPAGSARHDVPGFTGRARRRAAAAGSSLAVYEVVARYLDEEAAPRSGRPAEREIRAVVRRALATLIAAADVIEQLWQRLSARPDRQPGGRVPRPARRARAGSTASRSSPSARSRGCYKPDPDLFRHALRLAGVAPRASAHGRRPARQRHRPRRRRWAWRPPGSAGRGAAKGWRPDDPDALAYRDSLERSSVGFRTHERRPTER